MNNQTEQNIGRILAELTNVLEARKQASLDGSYVASLHAKGLNAILKKVGEEAGEVLIAAKDNDDADTVYEIADLWFHTLVLLSHKGLSAEHVLHELERRFDLSGLAEKAARKS